jgi:Arc/MetJ-type ribon-helix-helix transcriptional regulator
MLDLENALTTEATMNIKVSIELPERYVEFAEGMVRDGAYNSISEIVEEHFRDLMLAKHDDKPLTQEQLNSVMAMKDEIRRRIESPDEKWLNEEEFDQEFEKLLAYADEQIKAGR